MSKVPFYVGNFLAMFVHDGVRRARVRGGINVALYTPRIKSFIKRVYGESVTSIKFVRQINLNRFVCVANDKYYVKVFRNITLQRVQEHKFLVDFVRPFVNVTIPDMYVDDNIPMYVSEKIPGHPIGFFDSKTILANEDKIISQIKDIISQIQSVKVQSVPNYERFWGGLQPERQPEKELRPDQTTGPVLAHFDLNETNLFFDDDMNITGIIDWDTLSIAKNPETDMNVFMLFWTRFMKRMPKVE
ncbi:MAG: phosphotransferase [Alphaproteobacteria bacterium]|nr:phosphotransferase [Alphaproteobacteria bacterium]